MTKTFGGISKIMESDAIINVEEDAFHHRHFIIAVIVGDDESTIQVVIKNP